MPRRRRTDRDWSTFGLGGNLESASINDAYEQLQTIQENEYNQDMRRIQLSNASIQNNRMQMIEEAREGYFNTATQFISEYSGNPNEIELELANQFNPYILEDPTIDKLIKSKKSSLASQGAAISEQQENSLKQVNDLLSVFDEENPELKRDTMLARIAIANNPNDPALRERTILELGEKSDALTLDKSMGEIRSSFVESGLGDADLVSGLVSQEALINATIQHAADSGISIEGIDISNIDELTDVQKEQVFRELNTSGNLAQRPFSSETIYNTFAESIGRAPWTESNAEERREVMSLITPRAERFKTIALLEKSENEESQKEAQKQLEILRSDRIKELNKSKSKAELKEEELEGEAGELTTQIHQTKARIENAKSIDKYELQKRLGFLERSLVENKQELAKARRRKQYAETVVNAEIENLRNKAKPQSESSVKNVPSSTNSSDVNLDDPEEVDNTLRELLSELSILRSSNTNPARQKELDAEIQKIRNNWNAPSATRSSSAREL